MSKNSYIQELINEGMSTFNLEQIDNIPLRKAILVGTSPFLIIKHALNKNDDSIEIEEEFLPSKEEKPEEKEILDYTEMFITSYCSLRCRWCSASIPYYKHKYHINKDFLLEQLGRYLEAIDGVERFRLLGGDPFLHPDLADIMQPLIDNEKVKMVCLVSGGNLIPKNEKVLELLKNPKVYVDISNYGDVSCKVDEWQKMEEEGLAHIHIDEIYEWFVPNHIYDDKGYDDEQATQIYRSCPDFCHVLRDGKLFFCGEAFHIANIPNSPMVEGEDYVNVLDYNISIPELRNKINDLVFRRNKTMRACKNCVGSFIYKDRCLKAGEQAEKDEPAPFDIPLDIPIVSEKMI